MNCRHAQHLLDSYLDGNLPASLRAEVHAHRLTCSECQRAMVVTEVAGDVIATDRPEPVLSLGFTDRVVGSMTPPQERRVARIVRFRRAAAFLGPVLSAAAVWMLVVSIIHPVETVPTPAGLVKSEVVVRPSTGGAVEMVAAPTGSATIVDALAEGVLSPAMATCRDTQRSTRDLMSLGQVIFWAAGQSFGAPSPQVVQDAEADVLPQAESIWMNMLAPKTPAETGDEGPDVI